MGSGGERVYQQRAAAELYVMGTVGHDYTIPYECGSENDYDGRLGVRISAIFVIGFGSLCGMSAVFEPGSSYVVRWLIIM